MGLVRMTRARALAVPAAFAACAVTIGCAGILGLDETTLRPDDASTSDDGGAGDVGAGDAGPGDDTTTDAPSGSDAPSDAGGQDATPVFSVQPPVLGVHADASADFTVSVARNGLAGDIAVQLTQLPPGVSSPAANIAADAGSVQMTLQASATASPSGATPTSATLLADGVAHGQVPVVVYGASGTVDPSFQGGYAVDSQDPSGSVFDAVAIDSSGGIIAGGLRGGSSGGWILRRFAADGTPDATFDKNADAAFLSLSTGQLSAIAIDPANGRIVCTGAVVPGTNAPPQMAAVVLEPTGNLTGGFNGGTPFVVTPVMTSASTGRGVTVDSKSRFAIVGEYGQQGEAYLTPPIAESGNVPSSIAAYVGPESPTAFAASALDPSGRIVAAGSDTHAQPVFLVARFAGGALDPSFGDGGITSASAFCQAAAVTARPLSGKVFASGYDMNTDDGCFAQWTASGQLEYAKNGTAGGGGRFDYAGVAPMGDAQDRVYMVGWGGDVNSRPAEIDRVMPDGSYDPSFGGTGQVKLQDQASPPAYWYTLNAVAVQPDGRIVVAGARSTPSSSQAILGRFWP